MRYAKISAFVSSTETWKLYSEWLGFYFNENNIENPG